MVLEFCSSFLLILLFFIVLELCSSFLFVLPFFDSFECAHHTKPVAFHFQSRSSGVNRCSCHSCNAFVSRSLGWFFVLTRIWLEECSRRRVICLDTQRCQFVRTIYEELRTIYDTSYASSFLTQPTWGSSKYHDIHHIKQKFESEVYIVKSNLSPLFHSIYTETRLPAWLTTEEEVRRNPCIPSMQASEASKVNPK